LEQAASNTDKMKPGFALLKTKKAKPAQPYSLNGINKPQWMLSSTKNGNPKQVIPNAEKTES